MLSCFSCSLCFSGTQIRGQHEREVSVDIVTAADFDVVSERSGVNRNGLRLSGKMNILLTAIPSGLSCKCYHWICLLIKLVALSASAQVYLPKILHILVFHADKGAVVKETLVAMSVLVSCLCRNHLSNSFQTHSSGGLSNSCDPWKCSRNVTNEEKLGTSVVCTHPPLTQLLERLKWN